MQHLFGLTLDSVDNTISIIAGLVNLPRVTFRVVLDYETDPRDYLDACKELSTIADIMLQPVDSFTMSKYRLRDYSKRFSESLLLLGKYAKYLECGNEVNGEWTGTASEVADKVNNALAQADKFGIASVVTYFYDGDEPYQMEAWARTHVLDPDIVLASVYPNSSTDRPNFNAMFSSLESLFPKRPKGFGEYGTENAAGKNPSSILMRANLVRVIERYIPPVHVTNFIGGGFYWDAYEDVFTLKTAGLLPTFEQVWVRN